MTESSLPDGATARFWRTMAALTATACAWSGLSWLYLYLNHTELARPGTLLATLDLPVGMPSLWSVVRPDAAQTPWFVPFLVLILQAVLSAGYLGAMVRANLCWPVNPRTFLADGLRGFVRLLVWMVLWDLAALFTANTTVLWAAAGRVFTVLYLVAKFALLFGDVALVAEGHLSFGGALRKALAAWAVALPGLWPYGLAILLVTSAATTAAGMLHPLAVLGVSLLYCAAMTWLRHLVIARYLYAARWTEDTREAAQTGESYRGVHR